MLLFDGHDLADNVPVYGLRARRCRERAFVHPPVIRVDHAQHLAEPDLYARVEVVAFGQSTQCVKSETLEEVIDDLNLLRCDALVVILCIKYNA